MLQDIERKEAEFDDLLAGLPTIDLWYEDDLMAPERAQATAARLFRELDLPPHPVTSNLRKQAAGGPFDGIPNAEEIDAALRATGYLTSPEGQSRRGG
jgi:hypothetical protein